MALHHHFIDSGRNCTEIFDSSSVRCHIPVRIAKLYAGFLHGPVRLLRITVYSGPHLYILAICIHIVKRYSFLSFIILVGIPLLFNRDCHLKHKSHNMLMSLQALLSVYYLSFYSCHGNSFYKILLTDKEYDNNRYQRNRCSGHHLAIFYIVFRDKCLKSKRNCQKCLAF